MPARPSDASPTPASGRRGWSRSMAGLGLAAVVLLAIAAPAAADDQAVKQAQRAQQQAQQQAQRASIEANADQAAAERLADARVATLDGIDAQADRHAADKAELMARLVSYGYSGELGEMDYILPMAGHGPSDSYGDTGPLWATYHTGSDFSAPTGTPLLAIGAGTVTDVGDAGAYGLRTVLTLEDGTELWYCHQSETFAEVGEVVEPADLIGAVGSTGNTTGPHLHLEVRPGGGDDVDPVAWLEAHGLTP